MSANECHGFRVGAVLAVLAAALPAQVDATGRKPREERRAAILAVAERYATHRWRASEANVFHGEDPSGTRVDTPDASYRVGGFHADGRENVGVPYQWGGFSSIEEFDRGIAAGRYAGHLPKSGASPSSGYAVGVDCSGFVARCWDLPTKQSTRSIGNFCYELDSWDELRPGDILNSFDGHVVLFEEFVGERRRRLRAYHAAAVGVERTTLDVAMLKARGYVALRYKPLDSRWTPVSLAAPSFTVAADAAAGEWIPDRAAAPVELADLDSALADARPGEWVRYDEVSGGQERVATRAVAKVAPGGIEVQIVSRIAGKDLENAVVRDPASGASRWLLAFAAFDQAFDDVEIVASTVEPGTYRLGDATFAAHRIRAELGCALLSRGRKYPVTVRVDCVRSDRVPVDGMLRARYDVEVEWGEGRVSRNARRFALRAFRAPR